MAPPGRTHPTFVEIGTNKPLYVHREGSNVVNGRYYVDNNPKNTIGALQLVPPHRRRRPAQAVRGARRRCRRRRLPQASPLKPAPGTCRCRDYFAVDAGATDLGAESVIAALNEEGYWLAPLGYNSHPYNARRLEGRPPPATSRRPTSATRPTRRRIPTHKLMGISIEAYIRNMSVLIRALEDRR